MRNLFTDNTLQLFDEQQRRPIDSVPTHLPMWNTACRGDGGGQGLAKGWFTVVGGNPGYGKSLLAMNLAASAIQCGEIVGYVSLEMTWREIAQRVYAITQHLPVTHFEREAYQGVDTGRLREMMPFFVPDKVTSDWESVVRTFEDMYTEGARVFVLDYLQLVQAGSERSIYEAISNVVTTLRAWALNKGCVLVCLSQYNRETSKNYHDSPVSQSLWGGMMLEASSDCVGCLDHSRYDREGGKAKTYLIIDKNRHGPRKDIPILWDYSTMVCTQGIPTEINPWPKRRSQQ